MVRHPAQLIDEKARIMRAEDEASVRAVADEIFNYPHVLGRMPTPVEDQIKSRLIRSEMLFLQGSSAGVQEEDVVSLFNSLAERFDLPDYAKTSKKQVRALRMNLALAEPAFMGSALANRNIRVGGSISSQMSHLQAAHLLAVLLDQKFLDLNFQVPPDEWDREAHDKEIARIKEREEMLKSASGGQFHIVTRANPRRIELHEAITKKVVSMTAADIQTMLETVLRALKADR
jgi:hypothetical protein